MELFEVEAQIHVGMTGEHHRDIPGFSYKQIMVTRSESATPA